MNLSQVILLLAVVTFALYVFRFRTVLRDRLIYIFLIVAGLTFVIVPDFSTTIANTLGIGRGADLVLYAFIMFTLFHNATLASQLKKTEQQITIMVRHNAITGAVVGRQSQAQTEVVSNIN